MIFGNIYFSNTYPILITIVSLKCYYVLLKCYYSVIKALILYNVHVIFFIYSSFAGGRALSGSPFPPHPSSTAPLSPGPPLLLNPERVVTSSSDPERFPPHFQPNVALAPMRETPPPGNGASGQQHGAGAGNTASSSSYSQLRRARMSGSSRPSSPLPLEKVYIAPFRVWFYNVI